MAESSEIYAVGKRDTVLHALERAVKTAGDDVFIDLEGETFTFREVDRRSTRLAHSLRQLGVGDGDTVLTIFDTNPDVIPCWFAINKLGAIWVPVNTAYRQEFLRHQVADAGAELIICDPQYLERVIEISDRLPKVKRILCRGDGPFPDCIIPIERFDDYRGNNDTPIPINVTPADLAALLYTSGTTGPSKGCMISHNYMCMQGRQQGRAVPQQKNEVCWTCLPCSIRRR